MKTPLSLPLVMLILTVAVPRYGFSDEKPYVMASIGDSITAGTVADTSLVDDSVKMQAFERTLPGGSTKERLLALLKMQNKDTYSWTSGLKITSHFVKLRSFLGLAPTPADGNGEIGPGDDDGGDGSRVGQADPELVIANLAVPGDTAVKMVAQAKQLAKLMASGQYASLKYVTVLIGANDACHRVKPSDFRAQLKQSLDLVASIRQAEPIRVLISSIPKIPDVGRPEIQNHTTLFGLTCGGLHETINECVDLTTWSTPQEYQDRMAVVDGINKEIVGAANDASRAHPGMEIAYSNTLYSTPIPIEAMAADCFHPNAKGQQMIADKLWQDQRWFYGAPASPL